MGQSHWVHCEKGPAEAVLPSPAEEVQPATVLKQFHSAFIESVLCTSITVWFSSTTKSYLRRLRMVVRITGTTLPILQELYLSRVRKRAGKSLWTPHIQHTPSLNCCRLVDATELCTPDQPDTGTVSSPKQSISWTLGIKHGHTTLLYIIYSLHILIFFISNLHIADLYTQNCLYYILCFCYFVHCLFVYCYFVVCVLSCGASVTITNSSYV